MPLIELLDIHFRRNGLTILDGLTWRVAEGDHWAIVGANGSGKTTLLKLVTGYDWPTRGSVRVLGQQYGACDIAAVRRAIGLVSSAVQQRFHPDYTAEQIVLTGIDAALGSYREYAADEQEQARACLDAVGAGGRAEHPYALLSQGERQRVAIARALAAGPQVLILDEPCAGLDPAAREQFLGDLAELADADGPSLVMVTHHVEEIGPWLTKTLALRDGRAVAQGPTADVVTGPVMSEAFDMPVEVAREQGRYTLRFPQSG